METASPESVRGFWFGEPGSAGWGEPRAQWFTKDADFDAQIVERFGPTIEAGLAGELESWCSAPDAAVSYVIVLDQFTRNAFRGSARAFAGDPRALQAARRIVARGWDLGRPAVQRWFCYLPFEHSERLDDQRRSLELFSSLRGDPGSAGTIDYARRHLEVIERFGRFPHRNAALGRDSSEAERDYLAQPGSGF